MKHELEVIIARLIQVYCTKNNLGLPHGFFSDLVPAKDPAHGDFACNAAFKLSKLAAAKPLIIAEGLVSLLSSDEFSTERKIIAKTQIAGGGFINFYLQKSSLGKVLHEIHEKNFEFGKSNFGKGKRVLLEFVSANPTGPLTIAHGRQAAIGDALMRIMNASGHIAEAEYYLNDAGRQMNLLGASLLARYKEALGQSLILPEEGYQGEYLKEIAERLKSQKGSALLNLPEKEALDICRKFAGDDIMEGIKKDLTTVRVAFHHYFNESDLYKNGEVDAALKQLEQNGHLFEQEGALWFKSTAYGDDKDRVVRKSTGEFTYLAPDIAYHRYKYARGYQMLVNFLGPDHHGYIVRLKAACQALGYNADQIEVRIVQLSTLYRKGQPVRMSTRAGEFITLKELVDEVGADATRFFFVMRKIESHLDFDLDLAKEKSQDNPVFYLQYAHARIASLLKKSEKSVSAKVDLELLSTQEEGELIRKLSLFSEALIRSSQTLEPYVLADYLRELAACFHKFYAAHRIVNENDENLTAARLLLADATRIVMRNGLDLLGISQPESM